MTSVASETSETPDDDVRDPVFTAPGTPAERLMRDSRRPVEMSAGIESGEAKALTVVSEQFQRTELPSLSAGGSRRCVIRRL